MVMLLAYLDPGTGSLLLQLLVGGVSGFAVFGRYLWSQITSRHVPSIASQPLSGEHVLGDHS